MSRRILAVLSGALLSVSAPAVASAAESCENEARRVEQHATYLPDCRAYELVSPPDKGGSNVLALPMKTNAAVDGSAVTYASLGAFGDTVGTGLTTEYLARRDGTPGTSGWSSHDLLPKVEPLSLLGAGQNLDSSYDAHFSADLSKGLLRTFTNFTGDPAIANVENFYLRRDVFSPGEGSYELFTPCPLCTSSTPLELPHAGVPIPFIAGTSPDFEQVIFETRSNLVEGATGTGPKLYEWDRGHLYLVGILPASQGGGPAARAVAGSGASAGRYTPHALSADGSRVFFTVPTSSTSPVGPLYMRVNRSTTVQLNASERSECLKEPSSCPEAGEQEPVEYQSASSDGSRVFFVSQEQLTDTPGGGLYMYDTTRPDGDPHNLTLLSPDDEPADSSADRFYLMAASESGDYVYFTANSQLVAGGPSISGSGIYVWHEGTLHFIGTFARAADLDEFLDAANGEYLNASLDASRVTPDGKHFLFASHSGEGLTGYDHGSECQSEDSMCSELYLYDATNAKLVCASCNPTGAPARSDAGFTLHGILGVSKATSHLNRPLSDDGRYVFFTSGERLVPQDRNGRTRDVYEYDSLTGQLHLISSGTSDQDSYFLEASPDGRNVFFATDQRLLGWDADSNTDVYDARVNGGFPEPAAPVAECGGEGCQGALTSPSAGPLPGSASAGEAAGNVTPVVTNAPVRRELSRAQRLAAALKACKRQPRRKRRRCTALARRRYAAKRASTVKGRGK